MCFLRGPLRATESSTVLHLAVRRLIVCAAVVAATCAAARAEILSSGDVRPADPSTWTASTSSSVGRYSASLPGQIEVNGGSGLLSSYTYIGRYSGASGTVTVTGAGSTWNSNTVYVGDAGNGVLNIGDGGAVSVATIYVANENGSTGSIHFGAGGGALTTQSLYCSPSQWWGTGTVNARGIVSDDDLVFDGSAGSASAFTLPISSQDGGQISLNLDLSDTVGTLGAGHRGNGSLAVQHEATVSSLTGSIGQNAGSTGAVSVTGTGSTWASGNVLRVGYEGSGTLAIAAGGAVSSIVGQIGYWAGSTGAVTIDGQNSTWATSGNFEVGHSGAGTLSISAGGTVSNYRAWIGYKTDSTGEVMVNGEGSSWNISDDLYVGREGSAALSIAAGGLVRVDGTLTIDADADAASEGFINMSTGGMLALAGEADDSLVQFLDLVNGTDAIRYWDDGLSDWAPITSAISGDDYALRYVTTGNLAGYTLLTVGTLPTLPGDYNGNGTVDAADYTVWRDALGQGGAVLAADGDGSGTVDEADYAVWKSHFGETIGGGTLANRTVPEPATLLMLLLGMAAMFWRRAACEKGISTVSSPPRCIRNAGSGNCTYPAL